MRSFFRHMKKMEKRPGMLSANLFMVHPYNDAMDLGWAVIVTADGDQDLAERCAEELADMAWQRRKVELPEMYAPAEALDRVKHSPWRRAGAVSLVDVDDIVGTGAPGGNTHLLAELARDDRDLRTYLPLHSPAAVEEGWSQPEGAEVTLQLAGSPGYDDQPTVPLKARLVKKIDRHFGRTLRLDVGKLHVAITERPPYTVSPKFWKELGLMPREADVIVQKAFFHYRIFYAASSFQHIGMVSDGASSLERVRARQYAVPTWPGQDPGDDWRPYDPILRGLDPAEKLAAE